MSDFTFAHLSDPHLTTLEGVEFGELLSKRVLGYLSWRSHRRTEHRGEILARLVDDVRSKNPDHIVITGDLTHLGLPAEFQEAKAWLHDLGPASQVTVIPGNHETYVATAWENTFAHWAPYLLSDEATDAESHARADGVFPSVRIREHVAFIGLSSAQPTLPFLATGSLDAIQLSKLEEVLRELGRQQYCRVVLIHHPPVPGIVRWRKSLTNAPALESILSRCGAELVLHGHAHRSIMTSISTATQPIPVLGVPSASAVGATPDRRAHYHLYSVKEQSGTWNIHVQVFAYSAETEHFQLDHEQHLVPS
ncbi:metallophosphoesterase family protein [Nitrospira sp. M1]